MQDQITPPIDALFAQSISNFTLSADTIASTISTLQYTFTATAGHAIVIGNEILLLDTIADKSFYAIVLNVSVDTITVDRPIDHTFPAASALGRRVITNMAVDGSTTEQIFSVRAGQNPSDFTRFIIAMTDDTAMDSGTFGGITALTRGLVFRIINSFQKTIFCFKTNGEIAKFCYDVDYVLKAPAGEFGLNARISFAGQEKHGVALRISGNDVLQWVVQDDLRALSTLRIAAQGHDVTE
jgi:hypothetical protein